MTSVAANPFWPYEANDTMTDMEVRLLLDPRGLIEWDEPIATMRLEVDSESPFYGCRLCIARHGLKGHNMKHLPKTLEEFEQHRSEFHNPTNDTQTPA